MHLLFELPLRLASRQLLLLLLLLPLPRLHLTHQLLLHNELVLRRHIQIHQIGLSVDLVAGQAPAFAAFDLLDGLLGEDVAAGPQRDELVEAVVLEFGDGAYDDVLRGGWVGELRVDLPDVGDFADVAVFLV